MSNDVRARPGGTETRNTRDSRGLAQVIDIRQQAMRRDSGKPPEKSGIEETGDPGRSARRDARRARLQDGSHQGQEDLRGRTPGEEELSARAKSDSSVKRRLPERGHLRLVGGTDVDATRPAREGTESTRVVRPSMKDGLKAWRDTVDEYLRNPTGRSNRRELAKKITHELLRHQLEMGAKGAGTALTGS
jgi:hypothetical protein